MSRSRVPLAVSLALAGGAGYYLYSAGGDRKAAEKKFRGDIHSASDSVAANGQRIQTEVEKYGAKAGAKIDSAISKADQEYNRAQAAAREAAQSAVDYAKDTRVQASQKVDEIDRKVEEAAAKTKSSVSSWFGGK